MFEKKNLTYDYQKMKLPVYNNLLLYNINFDEVKRIILQWKLYCQMATVVWNKLKLTVRAG